MVVRQVRSKVVLMTLYFLLKISDRSRGKVSVGMIEQLFYFYKEHLDQLPAKYLRMMDEGESAERVVADYIAGMTDQYAITKFSEYFLPQAFQELNSRLPAMPGGSQAHSRDCGQVDGY